MFGRRLKIDRASVNDTGWYSCEGFNQYGHQTTKAFLLILPGKINTYHISITIVCAVSDTIVTPVTFVQKNIRGLIAYLNTQHTFIC